MLAHDRLDPYETSGPSPTLPGLHLIGLGAVGRALLRELDGALPVVAATDRSGTLADPRGLDPQALLAAKERGPLGGSALPLAVAVRVGRARDLVCLLPSERDRAALDLGWTRAALERGCRVVFAAKHVVQADPSLVAHPRVGVDAVLGGTGARLQLALPRLRRRFTSVAFVGNASTTTIVEAVERGASFDVGLARARDAGVLEPDPELDLRGADAATKLAVVAGALFARPVRLDEIATPDLRELDPELLRERARRGATTRLVARCTREGQLSLAFEEVARHSPLAVPRDRVTYVYETLDGAEVHVGDGIGPAGTARAVLRDLRRLGGVR